MGKEDSLSSIEKVKIEKNNIARFIPDIMVEDGDKIKIGNIEITILGTPGHSKGSVAYYFTMDNYKVCMPGDICMNTIHKNYIEQWDVYPNAWDDVFNWTKKYEDLPVDIVLGSHMFAHSCLYEKYQDMLKGNKYSFIDPTEWKRTLKAFRLQLQKNIKLENENRMWLDCSTPQQKLYVADDVTDDELYVDFSKL